MAFSARDSDRRHLAKVTANMEQGTCHECALSEYIGWSLRLPGYLHKSQHSVLGDGVKIDVSLCTQRDERWVGNLL